MIAGQPLFFVPWSEDKSKEIDDRLLSLISALGPLPDDLYSHWTSSSLYFTPERKLFNCEIGGPEEGEEPLMLEQQTMEELFDQASPDISDEESRAVKTLIRRILQYDPAKRPSAEEILLDPWFAGDEVDSS